LLNQERAGDYRREQEDSGIGVYRDSGRPGGEGDRGAGRAVPGIAYRERAPEHRVPGHEQRDAPGQG
jgi:hypothetical protein